MGSPGSQAAPPRDAGDGPPDHVAAPIYAIGLGSDGTWRHFVDGAGRRGAGVVAIDLADVVRTGDWRLAIPDDGASRLVTGRQALDLDPAGGYFVRLADLSSLEAAPRLAARWRALVGALAAWLDHVPGPVANRPSAWADNGAKPLHEARLARAGFAVPESLTSSDGERLWAFAAAGPTIVKPLSGVRARTRRVAPGEFTVAAGFSTGRGPVHLQRYVAGVDVRVHVCGGAVHAQQIVRRRSDGDGQGAAAVDYRELDAADLEFSDVDLPGDLVRLLVAATAESGLLLAGWDLRVDGDRYWVLEANPMPGYDWYDRRAGGVVTASLVDLLTRRPAAFGPAVDRPTVDQPTADQPTVDHAAPVTTTPGPAARRMG
ncbi:MULTISPECIES: ATP-grasp domain-containing protein [Frankia]|uniref:ATP-grasp domain-containing protein n=1 Tax=Frankia alni (strain DSM 45986 / CECT 9034 / ACN14a) TaxID=326424 RepID=Q0RSB9_FRAAA|nr:MULTISPECIES: hypothetical protein [Frankia]CAJ59545.1 hypothetical protein FRAAL0877 [Frankia alni ACN14a]